MINQKGCCGSRGLYPCVTHHIEDALITVMSDTRNDGYGEVGYILSQCQGVEASHITSGTTATNDHHRIIIITCRIDAVEGFDDASLDTIALHGGRKELYLKLKVVGIVGELVAEVAIAGSRLTGDDGNALTEQRQG